MGKAKKDFTRGVYRLLYKGNNEDSVNLFDLVITHSLTGDKTGFDGMNADFVYEENITFEELKTAIRKHKITKAIWINRNDYVMPKDVLSGKVCGIFYM